MLSEKTELDQMKVTVPIRLHFAVLNNAEGTAENAPLQFKTPHKDKYAIAVDKTFFCRCQGEISKGREAAEWRMDIEEHSGYGE
ncbi:MAG: hypothetical protein ACLTDX_08805 [[Clostridium] innocuum]